MIPVYIEVEDGERLQRALLRENRSRRTPKYEEMCRTFSGRCRRTSREENIREAGITLRFANDEFRIVCRKYYKIYKFPFIDKNSFEWVTKYAIM